MDLLEDPEMIQRNKNCGEEEEEREEGIESRKEKGRSWRLQKDGIPRESWCLGEEVRRKVTVLLTALKSDNK